MEDIRITIVGTATPDGKTRVVECVQDLDGIDSADLIPTRSIVEWALYAQYVSSVVGIGTAVISLLGAVLPKLPQGSKPADIVIELEDGTRITGDLSRDQIETILENRSSR